MLISLAKDFGFSLNLKVEYLRQIWVMGWKSSGYGAFPKKYPKKPLIFRLISPVISESILTFWKAYGKPYQR